MSNEEKRKIRAAALLEVAEAQEHLALLEAKMAQWNSIHRKLANLSGLAKGTRHCGTGELARQQLVECRGELPTATDLDALFGLDREITEAIERLAHAETIKNSVVPG